MQAILSGHSAYHLEHHVVWVCKYRRKVLKPAVEMALRRHLPTLLRRTPGVKLKTIGFDRDHLHMVMVIPPKYAIADVMGQLKSQSASILRTKFPSLGKAYWKETIVWSPGYFVSSVGIDAATITAYVERQGQQDSDQLELTL